MYIAGKTPFEIATCQNLSRGSIWSTIAKDKARIEGYSLPRKGRPKDYTDRDKRKLLRHVRLFPKHTYT